jgi:two-component system chemotaxis response regulator CheB
VIGVLLTGSTRDGKRGMEDIEAAGGIGIVQDPAEAIDPTMPAYALRGDHPDYCVPVDEMATLISQLVAGTTPMRR